VSISGKNIALWECTSTFSRVLLANSAKLFLYEVVSRHSTEHNRHKKQVIVTLYLSLILPPDLFAHVVVVALLYRHFMDKD
jgi:hypothetical protein